MNTEKQNRGTAPALTLMILAPLFAEVLPGATRLSSLFVLPIEICVWGGGALLIRYATRRWQLSWIGMLLLALALSISEECVIQQTSVAPMVLQLKGITYARAMEINYVYFLWALIYESVFVVFLPIYLTELVFMQRSQSLWVGKLGIVFISLFFLIGSILAWYSWTRIARSEVFHVPIYDPPIITFIIAALSIIGLVLTAFWVNRNDTKHETGSFLPRPWVSGFFGGVWAVLLYGLVLLGFGIAPWFPPIIAVLLAFGLATSALIAIPKWTANLRWTPIHSFAIIFGTLTGAMLAGFIGFIGASNLDLYFKLLANLIAIILFVRLGASIKQRITTTPM